MQPTDLSTGGSQSIINVAQGVVSPALTNAFNSWVAKQDLLDTKLGVLFSKLNGVGVSCLYFMFGLVITLNVSRDFAAEINDLTLACI